jgi:ABC-type multidrug transport system fused ATPase/permease subunit
MFAWEKDFKKRIELARANEVSYLRRFVLMRIVVICFWDATPTLVSLFTFIFHALILKRPLTASAGFAALALFDLLRFPLLVLPDMVRPRQPLSLTHPPSRQIANFLDAPSSCVCAWQINYLIKALVSFGRIEAFLEREEVSPKPMLGASTSALLMAPSPHLSSSGKTAPPLHTPVSGSEAGPMPALPLGAIRLRDASFRWGSAQGSGPLTLTNLNLNIEPGSLVCVYGPTGCGKTSLLMAMLGEIHRVTGAVAVNGRVAYVAQKSWIRNMTLRENILFGKRYDVDHYREVRPLETHHYRDTICLQGTDCRVGVVRRSTRAR